MTLSTYLLYLAAVALLVLSPGPTMLMCMTTALQHGPRRAMAAAGGSVTAVLGTMLLSALGLGALLAASETAFWILKAAGAAYLIWLGIKTFRSQGSVFDQMPEGATAAPAVSARRLFVQGLIVGGSNPKAILFFTAFFPQFLNPALSFAPQFAVLAATFVAFEFTVLTLCALGVARLAPVLRSGNRMRWFNRISGGLFTLMGSLLLATRRAA
ncbi:LysE family translocator [Acidovorax sp.]|uniref:LysE family translocator n=1 Tax=Acidovorax sp. TaxID=1872122 RepID=UPI002ACED799|nr:LysE family translocator [Acidovorax sp.]MDZ7861917.1 LysE family translocator [Acidovorax sp.]